MWMDSEKFLVEALQELIELKDLIKSGNNLIIMRFVKRSTLQLSQNLQQLLLMEKRTRLEYYNLDMIISVGCRVKSNIGVEFRR